MTLEQIEENIKFYKEAIEYLLSEPEDDWGQNGLALNYNRKYLAFYKNEREKRLTEIAAESTVTESKKPFTGEF